MKICLYHLSLLCLSFMHNVYVIIFLRQSKKMDSSLTQAGLRSIHGLGPKIRQAMSGKIEEEDEDVEEIKEEKRDEKQPEIKPVNGAFEPIIPEGRNNGRRHSDSEATGEKTKDSSRRTASFRLSAIFKRRSACSDTEHRNSAGAPQEEHGQIEPVIEIPPPPAEAPTTDDDEEAASLSEDSASEIDVPPETEPVKIPPSPTKSHKDLQLSKSLPDDELLSNRKSQSPVPDRQRSKSDPKVGVVVPEDSDDDEGHFLSPDDPLVQAVQREISEAFNVSNDELNYFAEELLTELAYMDDEDGKRMTSSGSVYTPSLWQQTYQNLPEDYTVTDV